MSRWMLTLVCALSVAAVAGAQDDDWDALLAGLGDEAIDEEPVAVETVEAEVAEEDPFADLLTDSGSIPEVAEEATEEAGVVAESFTEAVEAIPEATESADPFAGEWAEAEAEPVVEETVADIGDFDDDWDFDESFAEAPDAAEGVAEEAADAVEAIEDIAEGTVEASSTEIADSIVEETDEDAFADFFAETETAEAEEPAEEAIGEEVAGATSEEVTVPVPEEANEDPFADLFAEEAAESAVLPTEEAVEELETVEGIVAEVEPPAQSNDDFATVEEGESAATLIRKAHGRDNRRVRPEEPAVKPKKKNKFSSEARTPLKPKTAVPEWDAPVVMETPAEEAASTPRATSAAKRGAKDAWAEPVVW